MSRQQMYVMPVDPYAGFEIRGNRWQRREDDAKRKLAGAAEGRPAANLRPAVGLWDAMHERAKELLASLSYADSGALTSYIIADLKRSGACS